MISALVQPAKTQADVVTAYHHVMQDVLATMLKLLNTLGCKLQSQTQHSQVRVLACIV